MGTTWVQGNFVQGGGSLSFAPLANGTTADLIVDRMITVIESLAPVLLSADKFRRYNNEGDANFHDWALANPLGVLRRFQVRYDLVRDQFPPVANGDVEERVAAITVTIGYPQTARAGTKQALARDKLVDRDHDLLEKAIGLYGRPNFTAPSYPDAGCTGWVVTRPTDGAAVDFLVIVVSMRFLRQLSAAG